MKKMTLDIQRFNSTNKTTHYELSQYVASDKPTYLVDYNDDMEAIDTGIYEAKTQADLGVNNASVAQTTAETAQTTANTAVTNASVAQTTADDNTAKIGDLANLTTANKSNLVSATNELKTDINNLESNIDEIITTGNDYIKYKDGTMICYGRATIKTSINTQYGSVYRTDVLSIALSQTFIDTNYRVFLEPVAPIHGCYMLDDDKTTNSFKFIGVGFVSHSESADRQIDYMAIGKWK